MAPRSASQFRLPDMNDLLVLGVTGGIAGGKSTVADMLAELSAPIIDFDRMAREVVEPGKPAFKEIVAHFGRRVMGPDGTLDRKRLSSIVFQDSEKRRELEGITHPRIVDRFMRRVRKMVQTHPGGIIQAVIPLLFEVHLEHLVHKILVVYIPREVQIARLMKRDGITQEDAGRILNAQMPIHRKVEKADFVLSNEKSIEETQKAVEAVWKALKAVQNQPAAGRDPEG